MRTPSYTKIALDMAKRIEQNEFYEGQKLHGRSTLASCYCVSPETIRKAMVLLANMGIVEIKKNSGIYVVSREMAKTYIETVGSLKTVREIKTQILSLLAERKKIDREITDAMDQLLDYVHIMSSSSPIHPVEITIPAGSICDGKRIKELAFWENTGGTIVGVRRDADFILSPGPDFVLMGDDIVLIVGADEKAKQYIDRSV